MSVIKEKLECDSVSRKWKDLFRYSRQYDIPVLIYAEGGKFAKLHLMNSEQYASKLNFKPLPQPSTTQLGSIPEDEGKNSSGSTLNEKVLTGKSIQRIDLHKNGNRSSLRQQEAQNAINLERASANRWMKLTVTLPFALLNSNKILDKTFRYVMKKMSQTGMTALWRKEYQKRGVEHFHLLVYLPGDDAFSDDEVLEFKALFISNWRIRVHAACGVFPSDRAYQCDKIKSKNELEIQFNYQRKSERNASKKRITDSKLGKKEKRWGILNRRGYKVIVNLRVVKLESLNHFFTLKRHLYRATNVQLRKLKIKRRRRKTPFQIDSRFFVLNWKQVEAALTATNAQLNDGLHGLESREFLKSSKGKILSKPFNTNYHITPPTTFPSSFKALNFVT